MLPPRLVRRVVLAPLVIVVAVALVVLSPLHRPAHRDVQPGRAVTVRPHARAQAAVLRARLADRGDRDAVHVPGAVAGERVRRAHAYRALSEPPLRDHALVPRPDATARPPARSGCGSRWTSRSSPPRSRRPGWPARSSCSAATPAQATPLLLVRHLLSVYGRRPRGGHEGDDAARSQPRRRGQPPAQRVHSAPPGRCEGLFSEQIERLASGLDQLGALVIFPEGGNWTPGRWRRGIRRLEQRGRDDLAARRTGHAQPAPAARAGGALSAIAACPDADVIFVAHAGLDRIVTVGDVWRNLQMDQTVRARGGGGCRPAEVPRSADHEAQVQWLYDWWQRIDAWISQNRPDDAEAPGLNLRPGERVASGPGSRRPRSRCGRKTPSLAKMLDRCISMVLSVACSRWGYPPSVGQALADERGDLLFPAGQHGQRGAARPLPCPRLAPGAARGDPPPEAGRLCGRRARRRRTRDRLGRLGLGGRPGRGHAWAASAAALTSTARAASGPAGRDSATSRAAAA